MKDVISIIVSRIAEITGHTEQILKTRKNPQFGLVIDSNTSTSFSEGGTLGGINYMYRIGTGSGYNLWDGDTELASGSYSVSYPYSVTGIFWQSPSQIETNVNGSILTASTTVLSSGYIGFFIFSSISTQNQVAIHWLRTTTYLPNGMPTFTIGTGSNFEANNSQINYVHYSSASPYQYNQSLWQSLH